MRQKMEKVKKKFSKKLSNMNKDDELRWKSPGLLIEAVSVREKQENNEIPIEWD